MPITYNFYTVPDEMVVFDQGGNLIFDSGMISGSGVFNIAYTNSSHADHRDEPERQSGIRATCGITR